MITTCKCGAHKLLTATGVRFEENDGAICRHGVAACRWFAELPSEVAAGSRASDTKELLAAVHDWGVGASNRAPYLSHGMLCMSIRTPETKLACDCGLDEWYAEIVNLLGKG